MQLNCPAGIFVLIAMGRSSVLKRVHVHEGSFPDFSVESWSHIIILEDPPFSIDSFTSSVTCVSRGIPYCHSKRIAQCKKFIKQRSPGRQKKVVGSIDGEGKRAHAREAREGESWRW